MTFILNLLVGMLMIQFSVVQASIMQDPRQPFTANFIKGVEAAADSRSVSFDGDEIVCTDVSEDSSAWILTSATLKNNFLINYRGQWKLGLSAARVEKLQKDIESFKPKYQDLVDYMKYERQALIREREKLKANRNNPRALNVEERLADVPADGSNSDIDDKVRALAKEYTETRRANFAATELHRLKNEVGALVAIQGADSLHSVADPKLKIPGTDTTLATVQVSKAYNQDVGICPPLKIVDAKREEQFLKVETSRKDLRTSGLKIILQDAGKALNSIKFEHTRGLTKGLGTSTPKAKINLSNPATPISTTKKADDLH